MATNGNTQTAVGNNVIVATSLLAGNPVHAAIGGGAGGAVSGTRYITVSSHPGGTPATVVASGGSKHATTIIPAAGKYSASASGAHNVIVATHSRHGSPVILQSPSPGGTPQVFHTYTTMGNTATITGIKRERDIEHHDRYVEVKRLKVASVPMGSAGTSYRGAAGVAAGLAVAGGSGVGGKGLRHFSMKVCEEVRKRGKTTYNEVADALVNEFSERGGSGSAVTATAGAAAATAAGGPAGSAAGSGGGNPSPQQDGSGAGYDQKNIRRRVYDALNVLMAMGIIEKQHKDIHWLGLPTNSAQECKRLESEKSERLQRISQKTQQLYDLLLQHIAYKSLVERNKANAAVSSPLPNSTIPLPFIIVNTNRQTVIDCQISADKQRYLMSFDNSFEIHDDIEVLKRMGLAMALEKGTATPEAVREAKSMVPRSLQPFVEQLAKSRDQLPPDMIRLSKASLSLPDETLISILPSPSSEENYSEDDQFDN